jgi:hypothetical protein
MRRAVVVLSALVLASSVRAQVDPGVVPSTPDILVPPLTLKLDNTVGEASMRYKLEPIKGLSITPAMKGGVIAPTGDTGTPYSTLNRSPYANGSLKVQYTGPWEALAVGTLGDLNLHSRQSIGGGPNSDNSQNWLSSSLYLDTGKIVSVSKDVKAAFFAAVGDWGFMSTTVTPKATYYSDGMIEFNTGTLWMVKKGRDEATFIADLQLTQADTDMYRNGEYVFIPSGLASAEYAHRVGGLRESVGVEGTAQRADLGVRPYVGLSGSNASLVVAGNLRKTNDPFFPNVQGAGAGLRVVPASGWMLALDTSYNREAYPLAPQAYDVVSTYASLTVDDGKLYKAQVGWHGYGGSAVGQGGTMTRDYASFFDDAFRSADTYAKFINKIPAKGTDEILGALSVLTSTLQANNYNYNQDAVANVNDPEQLYERARKSYLGGGQKDPILVCKGSAQLAAMVARDLGAKAGIPIAATAVTVAAWDPKGTWVGHAVTQVMTPEYGIVIVDWGTLMPTYTWDSKTSLAVYQAAQGIPAIKHAITAGNDGHTVGWIFSEDGKALVRNLLYHGELPTGPLPRIFDDDPRTHELTIERYRELVRKAFYE